MLRTEVWRSTPSASVVGGCDVRVIVEVKPSKPLPSLNPCNAASLAGEADLPMLY